MCADDGLGAKRDACAGAAWMACSGVVRTSEACLQNSTETLDQLERAFDNIKRRLFSELHNIVRQQVFPADVQQTTQLSLPAGNDRAGDNGALGESQTPAAGPQHADDSVGKHEVQAGELAKQR